MASSSPPSPPHRRHHSEIDMSSLRRISEALLLAQNRARLATERANRCERVLRTVLLHVTPQLVRSMRHELDSASSNLLVDSMADWDMMQSMTTEQSMGADVSVSASLPHYRRHSIDVVPEEPLDNSNSDAMLSNWASMIATPPPAEHTDDVAALAKQIVANLHVAAARCDTRVQKLHASMPNGATYRLHSSRRLASSPVLPKDPNWLATWKHRLFRFDLYTLTPLQFVAGVLVGVAVGVSVTRHLQLLLLRRDGGGSTSMQLAKRLATCYTRRAGEPPATLQSFAFPVDDAVLESYYVHPTAVEVA